MSILRFFQISLFTFSLLPQAIAQGGAPPRVSNLTARLQEDHVAPGGILLVIAGPEGLPRPGLLVRSGEKRYPFFPHPSDPEKRMAALVPIPFDQTPGPGQLEIEAGTGPTSRSLHFVVTRGVFQTIQVAVGNQRVQLRDADKARTAREREEILKIYAEPAPALLWKEPFLAPLNSKVTCGFGVKRVFNGSLQSVHKGLDLRAATGTPVHAPAPGVVRLGKDLFYGGNLVLLDHGLGLFTAYAHLSKIQVAVGQTVQTGQILGLSGATGRVSAAHLHWDASIGGTNVDPHQVQRWTAVLAGAHPTAPKPPRPTRRKRP